MGTGRVGGDEHAPGRGRVSAVGDGGRGRCRRRGVVTPAAGELEKRWPKRREVGVAEGVRGGGGNDSPKRSLPLKSDLRDENVFRAARKWFSARGSVFRGRKAFAAAEI